MSRCCALASPFDSGAQTQDFTNPKKGTTQSTRTTSLEARDDFGIGRQAQEGNQKDDEMDKCTPEDVASV
jgi:hypothetical protein